MLEIVDRLITDSDWSEWLAPKRGTSSSEMLKMSCRYYSNPTSPNPSVPEPTKQKLN